jgi:hypothetical protein
MMETRRLTTMANDLALDLLELQPLETEAPFSAAEREALQTRLLPVWQRQIRLKTQGDHVSVREEEALELLQSVVFTLRLYLSIQGLPTRTLLQADPVTLLTRAQRALTAELEQTEVLYRHALRTVDDFCCISLRDTLSGIGTFFKRYDYRLYAHCIPAQIDYQLCHPMPETLCGVTYVRDYLQRLLTENELLTRFSRERVTALLARACPDYRELLVNLYEPVAAVTIGLALTGGGETLLELSAAQADRVVIELTALPCAEAKNRLTAAAHAACDRLGFQSTSSQTYLSQAALALYPRVVASPGSAAGVFMPVRVDIL